jgi:hypothetical protein
MARILLEEPRCKHLKDSRIRLCYTVTFLPFMYISIETWTEHVLNEYTYQEADLHIYFPQSLDNPS